MIPIDSAARRGRRHLLRVLAAGTALAGGYLPAWGQSLEIKLGHVGEPGSLFQKSADEFAKRANAKLAGKAKVVVYGSSQLGGDKEMLQKLKLGTLDMALPSTVMSSEVDLFGIFEMPYIVKDREHMKRIEKDIFWPKLEPAAEKKGLQVLAVWENGYRHITNNKRPIKMPADLQGIKLRVPEGKWRVKMFQAYGANPSPMKFSELFTALQTGVMDGEENPLTQIYSAKLQEVQKYLSLSGHVYTPAYLTVGIAQVASRCRPTCARSSRTRRRKRRPSSTRPPRSDEDDLLGKLKQAGMQVNEVDKDAFIAASKPIYDEFGKEVAGAQGADRPSGGAGQVSAHACRRLGRRRADAMQRFRAGYGRLLEWVVIALMVVLFARGHASAWCFARIGRSLIWYDEIASVLLAWLTFYGSALASVKRAHIGCPEVVEQLPLAAAPRGQHRRAGAGDRASSCCSAGSASGSCRSSPATTLVSLPRCR